MEAVCITENFVTRPFARLTELTFPHCVVPENIHTPTTDGIGNSEGAGGGVKDPGNSRGIGGCMIFFSFRGLLIQYRFEC